MPVRSDPQGYRPRRLPRHSDVSGREGRIALTHWGPPDPAPIVLLHGWMDCGAAWQLVVDCLPDDWPLVAVDWPGYGGSARRTDRYWYPDHLAELDWLLDQVSAPSPARLVGHSMGGTVASMYAGVRPERVRWVANLEGFGMPALSAEQLPGLIAGWLDSLRVLPVARRYASLDELAAIIQRANPRLPPAHAGYLASVWTQETDGAWEMRADPRQLLRTPNRYGRAEVEACWAQVRAPHLLLYGAESGYLQHAVGPDALQRLSTILPTMTARAVPEAGHLLPYEQPQRVAAVLVQFAAMS